MYSGNPCKKAVRCAVENPCTNPTITLFPNISKEILSEKYLTLHFVMITML
jgi:hypothetical protein